MSTTETDEAEAWPLGEIEPVLSELRAEIGIIGHLINSPSEVTKDEWQSVEDRLIDLHAKLHTLWDQAWHQGTAERFAHEAALAAVRAEKATPGSEADVKKAEAYWRMLRCAGHAGRVRQGRRLTIPPAMNGAAPVGRPFSCAPSSDSRQGQE